MTFLCKKIIVAKSKDVESRWPNSQEWTHLAESSKGVYSSKRAVLPVVIQKKQNALFENIFLCPQLHW
jgi:hypothetical protein